MMLSVKPMSFNFRHSLVNSGNDDNDEVTVTCTQNVQTIVVCHF